MSMLEDLFLEDEAGEAQELERVLEGGGDEYDERPVSPTSDDNEHGDDEAEEDKRRVDPNQGKVKRVIKNPRFVLNPARLTGPRGIQVIPEHFKDFKFKGKGHEKEDLDMVLKKLEHWAYRLYPKFEFHDCLKKIEMLGKKRPVMVHLRQIRSDQFLSEETVVQKDSSDDEAPPPEEDEFDKLLQQQIELARSTPAPSSVKKPAFSTPSIDRSHMMPKATSSPSISDEQRERMLRNRQLAEERRLAKLRNDNSTNSITSTPERQSDVQEINNKVDNAIVENSDDVMVRKHNRLNVIDSSDDEDVAVVNESITIDVDIHKKVDDNGIERLESRAVEENEMSTFQTKKPNRSNVIDSSDEEDIAVVNESILVDIDVHRKGYSTQEIIEIIDNRKANEDMDFKAATDDGVCKSNNDFDSLIRGDIQNTDDCDDIMINDTKKDGTLDENPVESKNIGELDPKNSTSNISFKDIEDESSENITKDQNKQLRNVNNETSDKNDDVESNIGSESVISEVLKDSSVGNSNKENIDIKIAEDIMDVDFNDDF